MENKFNIFGKCGKIIQENSQRIKFSLTYTEGEEKRTVYLSCLKPEWFPRLKTMIKAKEEHEFTFVPFSTTYKDKSGKTIYDTVLMITYR